MPAGKVSASLTKISLFPHGRKGNARILQSISTTLLRAGGCRTPGTQGTGVLVVYRTSASPLGSFFCTTEEHLFQPLCPESPGEDGRAVRGPARPRRPRWEELGRPRAAVPRDVTAEPPDARAGRLPPPFRQHPARCARGHGPAAARGRCPPLLVGPSAGSAPGSGRARLGPPGLRAEGEPPPVPPPPAPPQRGGRRGPRTGFTSAACRNHKPPEHIRINQNRRVPPALVYPPPETEGGGGEEARRRAEPCGAAEGSTAGRQERRGLRRGRGRRTGLSFALFPARPAGSGNGPARGPPRCGAFCGAAAGRGGGAPFSRPRAFAPRGPCRAGPWGGSARSSRALCGRGGREAASSGVPRGVRESRGSAAKDARRLEALGTRLTAGSAPGWRLSGTVRLPHWEAKLQQPPAGVRCARVLGAVLPMLRRRFVRLRAVRRAGQRWRQVESLLHEVTDAGSSGKDGLLAAGAHPSFPSPPRLFLRSNCTIVQYILYHCIVKVLILVVFVLICLTQFDV